MVHDAVIRGTVADDPQYVKNGTEDRCVFKMIAEIKGADDTFQIVPCRVVTDSTITKRCENLLEKGQRVVVMGPLAMKNKMVKVRAMDIHIPGVMVVPAT